MLGQICTLSTSTSCSPSRVPRLLPGLPLRPARTCTTYICLLSFIALFESFSSLAPFTTPNPDRLPLRHVRPHLPVPRPLTIPPDLHNLYSPFLHFEVRISPVPPSQARPACSAPLPADMDSWRVAVLGDGGVGKTALAVQVRRLSACARAKLTEGLVYAQLLRR